MFSIFTNKTNIYLDTCFILILHYFKFIKRFNYSFISKFHKISSSKINNKKDTKIFSGHSVKLSFKNIFQTFILIKFEAICQNNHYSRF